MNPGALMADMPFVDLYNIAMMFGLVLILRCIGAKHAGSILAALTIAALIWQNVWNGNLHIAWFIAMISAILYAADTAFIWWKEA